MDSINQIIRNLGWAKIGTIAAIAFGMLAFLIFMATNLSSPNMETLFTNLSQQDSTQIQSKLALRGTTFETRDNGQTILVPSEQVGPIRLQLAEEGLGGELGGPGNELFDREEQLGSSSFLQQVNRTRAMEGELARTISSISTVQAARVHLVMPRRELFSREVQEPSASIVLKMRGAQRLDRQQVQAIQHLIATAVARLKPSNISIVDNHGTLLHRGGDEDGQAGVDAIDMRTQYEARMRQRVQDLLERTFGFGKVRVEVQAEMDFTQTVINSETYDPEGQVLRSSETIEEASNLSEAGDDAVSVGNNLPNAPGAESAAGSSESSSRTEERSNFEISKTLTNTVEAPGKIDKLTAAILVDGTYTRGEPTDQFEDGELIYQPRTQEEMEQAEKLVKTALGFDSTRGDVVEIVNMRFAESPLTAADEIPTFLGLDKDDVIELARPFVLLLVVILMVWIVVRPVLTKLLDSGQDVMDLATGGAHGTPLLTDQSEGAMAALEGAGAGGGAGLPMEMEDDEMEAMIDIAQIEGKVKASTMNKIGEIIDKHPEEAVSIIRNWMYQDSA
ncbi:flagellar basal-body MS-ring/collar protein FliF [Aestuariispira insulae]|uniref:Flagellar M-ring protein n=1 Tax=Aestuariispira insulae TaxID=1461337 RepID=A0A3D9HU68_9PROT|nr:flagellar basal-body MS-ring/collar protein FliF [Aestuariispira insulae]RED52426.1 flagellar M-ring protein FliF [Aestuariispira insulae]